MLLGLRSASAIECRRMWGPNSVEPTRGGVSVDASQVFWIYWQDGYNNCATFCVPCDRTGYGSLYFNVVDGLDGFAQGEYCSQADIDDKRWGPIYLGVSDAQISEWSTARWTMKFTTCASDNCNTLQPGYCDDLALPPPPPPPAPPPPNPQVSSVSRSINSHFLCAMVSFAALVMSIAQ